MSPKVYCIIMLMMLLAACATYYTTPQSLVNQLKDSRSNGEFSTITEVNCIDKDGKARVIQVDGNTQMRITRKDNSREAFYFSTGYLLDSMISGKKSIILGIMIRPVKLSDIKMIELQQK